MTGFGRWLAAVVGVSAIWLLPVTSLSAQSRVDPEAFLRAELGFDDGEIERLARGDAVTILIDGNVSVTVLEVSGDEVVLVVDAPDWIEVREQEQSEATDRPILAMPR